MPRRRRADSPDLWHHVMNRGVARRTLFETRADIRTFLSRLALEVRAGRIELHAFCILTTHFHLLVRSPIGELSAVMQHVQNEYARWFNRTRQRDGPLYRARFQSKRVETMSYRELLVRYIDANPVSAGLVVEPASYPHGSALSYARERGPVWLERSWIESVVCRRSGRTTYDPSQYPLAFGARSADTSLALVDRRLAHSGAAADPLDDLLNGAVGQVREWMRRKAALADGTDIGLAVCDVDSVDRVISEARDRMGNWSVRPGKKSIDAWPIVHVALLRQLCGSTLGEAGSRTQRAAGSAWVLEGRHRQLVHEDDSYAMRVAELARAAIERCHRGDVQVVGR